MCEDIVSLNDCKSNSLFLYDCISENQYKIKEYFVMGVVKIFHVFI